MFVRCVLFVGCCCVLLVLRVVRGLLLLFGVSCLRWLLCVGGVALFVVVCYFVLLFLV